MGMKRKADEGDASTSEAAPVHGGAGASGSQAAKGGGGGVMPAARNVRARVLDDLLGDLSGEESSSDAGE